VLYGSESEADDSDTESVTAGARKMGGAQGGPRLRVDDDEPMDLLQGAAARITSEPSCFRLDLARG
jgi:ribosomal RNA-processing protein 12